ncbi:FadR/GntR family transcriptional regulator [Desulfuribacillus alkaliarsenatis]|uniref:HTH gntR-type domain-containing protein n=1 Tax=Desulfuribacillus alkaliarsenatis TaxID=766136 RepID=A0A1E5FYG3_9FIRM|nr:FadR/GntR family transcriptional regulator [Desulfuribacillus alkaliarsenatis]OEF95578.1 hypothetical protein BHF68_12035 [Desulfuribacillus alkaliarsenatis]
MLEPVKKKRLYEEIMQQIRSLIIDGKFQPGDKLPSERDLATKLGVARSSVREALRALELLGYLESRQGEGTFIKNHSNADIVESMAFFILKEKDTLDDLFEVREILECEMACLAAERATGDDIEKLEEILAKATEFVTAGKIPLAEDSDFHNALAEASRNDILMRVMHTIADFIRKGREGSLTIPGRPHKSIKDHYEILQAVKEQDGNKAREAMRKHLKTVKKELFGEA